MTSISMAIRTLSNGLVSILSRTNTLNKIYPRHAVVVERVSLELGIRILVAERDWMWFRIER